MRIGAMNHPARPVLEEMAWMAAMGLGIMIENVPGPLSTALELGAYLETLPELGLDLDIGHCHLQPPVNTTDALIAAFGHRLQHVHLHDNKGGG